MKVVVISDTHGHHLELSLPQGDIIIHSGDFCQQGTREEVEVFLAWYDQQDFTHKILIGGNHDFFIAHEPEAFQAMLPIGVTYLNDSGVTIDGLQIWGSPVQPDLIGWAFGKDRGIAMREHWNLIPQELDILVTHTPPFGILDKSGTGRSLGCEELADRLDQLSLKVHVFGHIHASYGQETIEGTKYINASNMDSVKGLINPPMVFEL